MEICYEDKSIDNVQELSLADRFSKFLRKLEHCNEIEQKHTILEMNGMIEEMNEQEFISIFRTKLFDKMDKMIEEKTLSWRNAILLLKHAGYYNVLKRIWIFDFKYSSLNKRFEKIIIYENEKKKGKKNENFLVDLCECFVLLKDDDTSNELESICVPCLLKAASNKEDNEETKKEVEIALLALINYLYNEMDQGLYLNVVKEIIQYHQEHRNLTHVAYLSAWDCLIKSFSNDKSLEEVITKELHFVREAERELEELSKCMDWKRKEEENGKRKETKEEILLISWSRTLKNFIFCCQLRIEDCSRLIYRIVQVFYAGKDNNGEICNRSMYLLQLASDVEDVKVDDLLKGGAIDAVLEEIHGTTIVDEMANKILHFYKSISRRLKGKEKSENDEMKRKAIKMEIFEKLEEEGYEDSFVSFYGVISFLYEKYYRGLSKNISDYFVNV
ncbi:uncharacterized protein MONOS_18691 [Monocercomonoides exilis]|uniref:uncharacterized protein n=1 Tax=Monocercomonoides exilis TaxID=2049356 RepID=UPI0035596422|nr:hypothetical protein MONOS_18691 [Monocercomonoides exilis]